MEKQHILNVIKENLVEAVDNITLEEIDEQKATQIAPGRRLIFECFYQ